MDHKNATDLDAQAAAHGALCAVCPWPRRKIRCRRERVWHQFLYADSLSNAYRLNYTPRVFSANEAPPEVTIFLHHEMAQTPIYPVSCSSLQTAHTGSAAPISRSDILWQRLTEQHPGFAEDCETKGLKYSNVMPAEADKASGMGHGWQSTFSADTREAAQDRMTELDYTWEWQPNGDLRATTPVLPAVRDLGDGRQFLQPTHRRLQRLERHPQ